METELVKIPVTSLIIEFKDKQRALEVVRVKAGRKEGRPTHSSGLAVHRVPAPGEVAAEYLVALAPAGLTQSSGPFPFASQSSASALAWDRVPWVAPVLCGERVSQPKQALPSSASWGPGLTQGQYVSPSAGGWGGFSCPGSSAQNPCLYLQEPWLTHILLCSQW